ncbi:TM2 domain-containing protein [Clostridium sp. BNL1100]|uniref:TM2 domain-containing protein n=1 Tax=Clostridium sp. BNL1100 TaxID=755731 RepID=UPI00024A711A|nr:TM2 domain-containing protein [Clostridium sp. BNL1100]AEY65443.1 putative membrane protein [Clostridium sp. BNL1100]
MAQNECPQCGAPNALSDRECKYCGEALTVNNNSAPTATQRPVSEQQEFDFKAEALLYQQQVAQQQFAQQQYINNGINPAWPIKNKIVAGLLAIFLGGLGIHKFYMGKIGKGILYLLFSWTFIPSFIAFIEGIVYLCSNDHNFQVKHHVRFQ